MRARARIHTDTRILWNYDKITPQIRQDQAEPNVTSHRDLSSLDESTGTRGPVGNEMSDATFVHSLALPHPAT